MSNSEPNKSSSKSLLLPILLLLCVVYISASSLRSCNRERQISAKQDALMRDSLNRIALQTEIDSLKISLSDAYQKINMLETSKNKQNLPILFGSEISEKGTYFEVQIGAFQFFDLSKYKPGFNAGFKEIHDTDELDKYVIAKFRTYSEADAFKRDMIRLGIDDAWIVAQKDGKRINKPK